MFKNIVIRKKNLYKSKDVSETFFKTGQKTNLSGIKTGLMTRKTCLTAIKTCLRIIKTCLTIIKTGLMSAKPVYGFLFK